MTCVLQILFLLDVDNVAFNHMLSERVRTRVQKRACVQLGDPDARALAFSNQVHAVLIICTLLYNVYQNPFPIAKFIMFWPLFWVGGVADCVFGGGTPLEILQRVGSTTVALVAGFLCYFINWLLITGDIG